MICFLSLNYKDANVIFFKISANVLNNTNTSTYRCKLALFSHTAIRGIMAMHLLMSEITYLVKAVNSLKFEG